ncbi:winged helix-turn-helix transcriptional regulator [Streptomyces justiciae]|uniref:winged helix-turn-helix transcriptional regulator n=1 Tax=Streptomyces justiciae TaxID=2780140 RepID=UPI0021181F1D|nr:helix-turn-helix domain-containing protein [Streptomyces justiciae]MCW8384524.1 helix-turn-helix transcriptional regulator [Streptomyces justiciae]
MTTHRPERPAAPGPQTIHDDACPLFGPALELVGRRWTGSILTAAAQGATRFSEYRAAISGISDRLLALRLKELGEAGLVDRSVIPSTPVQVRYTLSPDGIALVRALQPLARWTRGREDDTPQ